MNEGPPGRGRARRQGGALAGITGRAAGGALMLALASGLLGAGVHSRPGPGPAHGAGTAAPVFAYYYLWMRGSYWSAHKLDHPVRPFPGDYRSADPAVIRWQIRQAKAAGLTGFIVSWKDTPAYRVIVPRLEAAAARQHFRLIMLYEGLDHLRRPLPVSTVAAGFRYFARTYAPDPVWYRIAGRPLTIWHGTGDFTAGQVASVTGPLRRRLLILNSANNVAEFERLAPYTDGDAYYWSSVTPGPGGGWRRKLDAMGAAVHRRHQTWVAPFAPGFSATLIGGHITVPRRGGATLRAEYAGAAGSAPDIMGLISWNEWTENTYVEPSLHYRYIYVHLLRRLTWHA